MLQMMRKILTCAALIRSPSLSTACIRSAGPRLEGREPGIDPFIEWFESRATAIIVGVDVSDFGVVGGSEPKLAAEWSRIVSVVSRISSLNGQRRRARGNEGGATARFSDADGGCSVQCHTARRERDGSFNVNSDGALLFIPGSDPPSGCSPMLRLPSRTQDVFSQLRSGLCMQPSELQASSGRVQISFPGLVANPAHNWCLKPREVAKIHY
jgi:hypothetical protein